SVFGDAATLVRAGILMGPHDNTVRLSWWLARVARGGRVLAPGDPGDPAQLIDVRDLAAWMLHCGERRIGGAFIATSAPESATFGQLLGECVAATGSDAQVAWVPDEFLIGQGIEPWTELPLWSPKSQAPHTWDIDSSESAAAGLVIRPLAETVADTWAWMRSVGVDAAVGSRPGFGIDPAKESAVLAAWLGRYPAGMAERDELLSLIRDLAVVRGKVTLSSGIEADYYVDLRRITLHHAAAPLVGTVMLDATSHLDFDAVGGLTLGADPVSTAMLHAAAAAGRKLDAFVVRKAAKAHGLQRRIEGPDIEGRRVLIVEDTSTTGGSPLTAAEAAREAGAEVVAIATIVDRGAAGAVRAAGYEYVSAFGVPDLGV
ncbi:MAG: orotate phosphoribosyltransferase, partial [Actinomycetia bacterium]|nr:orotate phosphoribosyltransferase [Actinomycetes bacterium]